MSNIIPFSFDSKEIRVVTDGSGAPWFVAKDVAETLGYDQTANGIKHCKHASTMDELNKINGLPPATKWVPESDVYRMIMRSNLPAAERFQDWVTEDVLPSVRKTGAYQVKVNRKSEPDPEISSHRKAVAIGRSYLSLGKMFGTDVAMTRAIAAERIKATTGIDVTPLLAGNSVADAPITPTELGKSIGVTGRAMNAKLALEGLQAKDERGEWRPTEKGAQFCTVNPYKSQNSEHAGYRVLWYKKVLDTMTSANLAS